MDFSKRKVAEEYRIYCALGGEEPDPGYFGAWLITQGYVEDLSDVTRWHVGSYSDFTP